VSVCVTLYKTAPGHYTYLKPVSLKPAWPEPAIFEKKFAEKWSVGELPEKW